MRTLHPPPTHTSSTGDVRARAARAGSASPQLQRAGGGEPAAAGRGAAGGRGCGAAQAAGAHSRGGWARRWCSSGGWGSWAGSCAIAGTLLWQQACKRRGMGSKACKSGRHQENERAGYSLAARPGRHRACQRRRSCPLPAAPSPSSLLAAPPCPCPCCPWAVPRPPWLWLPPRPWPRPPAPPPRSRCTRCSRRKPRGSAPAASRPLQLKRAWPGAPGGSCQRGSTCGRGVHG